MTSTLQVESSRVQRLFSFPNPVNEVSARLVAGGVVLMAAAAVAFDLRWMPFVLAYGFLARVLTGPTLSPLGQLVTRAVTPRLGLPERLVPGPPKRFAQGIGLVVTATAAVLSGLGEWTGTLVFLGMIIAAALLESVFGYCLGCKAFAILMRLHVIPEEVCERCNNIWAERGKTPVGAT
jgi:hypothetical protein